MAMSRISTTTVTAKAPSSSSTTWRRLRFIPLVAGALAMAVGLWTGLARLGLSLPGGMPALAEFHAALMIAGFLGTLISLERAVALGRCWGYAAPALSALAAVALFAGAPGPAGVGFLLASGVLFAASVQLALRHFALFSLVLAVAPACWVAGTALWLTGSSLPEVSGLWLDFLVLTVAAERLELGRIRQPSLMAQAVFAAAALLVVIGGVGGPASATAARVMGSGLVACAAWLLRYDIAARTIRQSGQTRFSACCILAGHVWLGIAGIILLLVPPGATAFSYDAAVHAIAIGFVLSMIFGHAPIILPAVVRIRVGYRAAAYVWLALLHVSLVLRVGGDLLEFTDLRAASGILTVLALAGYAMTLATAPRAAPA